MELMVEYGMKELDVLKAATLVNAKALHMENEIGAIKPTLKADLVIVQGDPSKNISDLRKVQWVMKNGVVVKK
jgi:imidazolonepropionase-like amidohydrolase